MVSRFSALDKSLVKGRFSMCCYMHKARVDEQVGTKLFGGVVDHPQHGRVHVIGYSNSVANLYGGPNCMIIHIPSRDEMGPANFINPRHTGSVLGDMHHAVFPPMPIARGPVRFTSRIAASGHQPIVQRFDVGDYEVLLADEPAAIPAALERISPEKRPAINEEIFSWYQRNMPGWHMALFCFSAEKVVGKPVFYWYHPLEGHENVLRLPAIDSHDGTAPELGKDVRVAHELYVSWPGIKGKEMSYPHMPGEASVFMPTKVAGVKAYGIRPNGDFGIDVGTTVDNNGFIFERDVRRLSLPGSPVRL